MKKIILQGFYGVHNLGDDYILYSILNTLDKIDNCKVIVYSYGDEYEYLLNRFKHNEYFIKNISKMGLADKLKDLKGSTHWIIGGGGLFPKEHIGITFAYFAKIIYARVYKTRVAIYGVEYNSFNKKLNTYLWKLIFKSVDKIWLRNQSNAEKISEMKIENVYGSSDVTFSLLTGLEKKKLDPLFVKRNVSKRYIIWALGMPWTRNELQSDYIRDRFKKLRDFLVGCLNDLPQYEHVLLPFYHDMDIEFISDIKTDLKVQYYIFPDDGSYDIDEKRSIFAGATMAVCMRFHSVIFSLYNETPFCAISYSSKTSDVLKEAHMEDRMVTIGIRKDDFFYKEFDVDEIEFKALINKTLENLESDKYREHNHVVAEMLKQKAGIAENGLLEWLHNT